MQTFRGERYLPMVGMKKNIHENGSLPATCNKVSSMNQEKGYDISIGPSRVVLKFIGIWPDTKTKKNLFSRGQFLIPAFVMFYFVNVPQTLMAAKVWGDLNAVLDILTTLDIPIGVALFKMLGFWYNRDVLEKLKLTVIEDWRSRKSPEELQIMWKYAKLSRLMSIIIILLAEGTIIAQFAMVMYLRYGGDSKHQKPPGYNPNDTFRPMYMSAQFFYDVQPSPQFEITWLFQCSSAVFAASAFSSVDAFFAVLVLHLCSQLSNLKGNLKMLSNKTLMEKNDSFINILTKIVIRHEFLYNFANEIESAFNLRFLVQMISCSIVICLQGYQLVLITTAGDGIPILELVFMLYFILCFMFSVFVYCYVAEVLRTESMEVGNAAYECDWYNMRPADTKHLIFVMVRAKQPFKITAGKFSEFSLNMYCSILRTSGGYLSMLLAMRDRLY